MLYIASAYNADSGAREMMSFLPGPHPDPSRSNTLSSPGWWTPSLFSDEAVYGWPYEKSHKNRSLDEIYCYRGQLHRSNFASTVKPIFTVFILFWHLYKELLFSISRISLKAFGPKCSIDRQIGEVPNAWSWSTVYSIVTTFLGNLKVILNT